MPGWRGGVPRVRPVPVPLAVLLLCGWISPVSADSVRSSATTSDLDHAVSADDIEAIKALGPSVMPRLAGLYAASADEERRQRLATVFYRLGWRSEEARDALMKDV